MRPADALAYPRMTFQRRTGSFIKPLEEEEFSKGMIVRELMEEFDLEKEEAVKIFKRYLEEKSSMEEDDFIDDTVEDDDYSDGNRSNI